MATKIKGRECPKDFKKPELLKLTSAKLGVPAKSIQRLNKDSLCQTYIKGVVTSVPTTRGVTKIVKKVATKKPSAKVPSKTTMTTKRPSTKVPKKTTTTTKKTVVPKKSVVDKKTTTKKTAKPVVVKKTAKPVVVKKTAKPVVVKKTAKDAGDKKLPPKPLPKPPKLVSKPLVKKVVKKKTTNVTISPYVTPKSPKPTIIPPKNVAKRLCIEQSNIALKEHQIRVVNHIRKHRGLIVSHAVGSGKTLSAVTATQCYLEDNPNGEVIIVTPVSLQENMKKEMKQYGFNPDKDPRYHFYTFHGFAAEYATKVCRSDAMLVIDEAHELRTEVKMPKKAPTGPPKRASRAATAIRCAAAAKKVLLLTATTVYNSPYDIANLVAMANGQNPPTKNYFENKIMSSADEFRKFFSCVLSFYDTPKDDNYPEVREHWMEIEMSKSYYRSYRDVEQKKSYLFSNSNPWRFLTGVRQASNVLDVCDKCKIVVDKYKRERKKTVIYSAFLTFGVKKIQELFDAENIGYVQVTGAMKKDARDQAVKSYNENKVDVLFITKAGGQGLDLKGTRDIIIFESSWNRPNEIQVIGRGARYKSHAHLPVNERFVDVYHLIIVKPKIGRDPGDTRDSADEMLKQKTEEKDTIGREFLKLLYDLSIEQTKC